MPVRPGSRNEVEPRQGAHVVEMQRRRLLSAMVEVLDEYGYEGAAVGRICKRAGVSRRTFYDLYDDREGCFLDAFELAIQRFAQRVAPAYVSEDGNRVSRGAQAGQSTRRTRGTHGANAWRERVRAALATLLASFDAEPGLARLCLVETLKGGPPVLERRRVVTQVLVDAVDAGRTEAKAADPPPLTAESLVGGALSVVHARLVERERRPLVELLNPLMSMIVLPYLGPAAARKELERPVPVQSEPTKGSNGHAPVPASDPFRGLPIRITFRTVRVISVIASLGGQGVDPSNREIAQDAGVTDQGQMSKLLARLEKAGLIENHGEGQARGEANAWRLTAQGHGVLHAVGGDGT
jgi:AcrR family transcriptional regulator